jgi:hypothetical protein
MEKLKPEPELFRVLITKENDWYVAFALEWCLCAQAQTITESKDGLCRIIIGQTHFSPDGFMPADLEIIQAYENKKVYELDRGALGTYQIVARTFVHPRSSGYKLVK